MANTSAPLSEVAVANMAATALDERYITSLDQETTFARFVAANFGYVRDEVLRMYPWAFAMKRAALPASAETPAFGYKYSYPVPTDCLRVLPLRCNGLLNGAPIKYEYESRALLTDAEAPLLVRYIRRVTNPAEFDPLFARVFGLHIAYLAANRVTGKTSFMDRIGRALLQALQEAKHVDSLERGTQEDQHGPDNDLANVLSIRGAA